MLRTMIAGLILFIAIPLSVNAQSVPLEPDVIISAGSDYSRSQLIELVDPLVSVISVYGYRCGSISSIRSWVLSRGFTVQCNRFAYKYEISDKGGTWVAELK